MELLAVENLFENDFKQARVDSRITYPCYKSLDEYIDVEHLRSLDSYLIEKINHHNKTQNEDYFLTLYRLDAEAPYRPGVREIWLSRTKPGLPPEDLDLVDKTDIWELTENAGNFEHLMDFIATLPFQATGRMLIFYDDAEKSVPAHRDHLDVEICNEFFWFRTNLRKPFYVLNQNTTTKKYIEAYCAWFDSVNQYHGCDATRGLSFSVRVDGIFTDEFRKLIPVPDFNAASTPALWASISEKTDD